MDVKDNEDFPLEIRKLLPDVDKERKKYFKDQPVICIGPKNYILTEKYKNLASSVYNLQLKEHDLFVMGLPRSGTNLTQELVWNVANGMDNGKCWGKCMRERFPFLERSMLFSPDRKLRVREENKDNEEFLKFLDVVLQPPAELMGGLPSPRFVKTHLPMSLLPPALLDTARVVYVARDPRDVAVSDYHFLKNSTVVDLDCDLKTYWDFFMRNSLVYGPYFEHVKEAWSKRRHPNMLFLFYEELNRDLPSAVRRVANFLGKQFTEEELMRLCNHLRFDNYKQSKTEDIEQTKRMNGECSGNAFIRRGKAGGWRDYFDEEMTQKAERWIADNLSDTDVRFPNADDPLVDRCKVATGSLKYQTSALTNT